MNPIDQLNLNLLEDRLRQVRKEKEEEVRIIRLQIAHLVAKYHDESPSLLDGLV